MGIGRRRKPPTTSEIIYDYHTIHPSMYMTYISMRTTTKRVVKGKSQNPSMLKRKVLTHESESGRTAVCPSCRFFYYLCLFVSVCALLHLCLFSLSKLFLFPCGHFVCIYLFSHFAAIRFSLLPNHDNDDSWWSAFQLPLPSLATHLIFQPLKLWWTKLAIHT